jgi:hypothetical protein
MHDKSLSALLQELISSHQWMVHRADKAPRRATDGKLAAYDDSANWCSYHEAVAVLAKPFLELTGIGFVLTRGNLHSCIDLDDAAKNPKATPELIAEINEVHAKIRARFDGITYGESSPSGTGRHIWGKGTSANRQWTKDGVKVCEIFGGPHYVTMTGNANGLAIADAQSLLDELVQALDTNYGKSVSESTEGSQDEFLALLGPANLTDEQVSAEVIRMQAPLWSDAPAEKDSEKNLALAKEIAVVSRDKEQTLRVYRTAPSTQRDKAQKNAPRTVFNAFVKLAQIKFDNDIPSYTWHAEWLRRTLVVSHTGRKQEQNTEQPAGKEWSIDDIKDPRDYGFPPAEWIIPGLLCEALYTLIVAPDGAGKSILALALARAISEGRPFLGHKVKARQVLYLDRENPHATIEDRFLWLGLKRGNPLLKYFGLHEPGQDVPWPNDPKLIEWVRANKPVIVFDSLVRYLPKGDDAPTADIVAFNKHITLLRGLGCTPIVLHHTGKGETTLEGRGSKDITAGCDFKLLIEKTRTEGELLRQIKIKRLRTRLPVKNGIPETCAIDIGAEGSFTIGVIAGTQKDLNSVHLKMQGILEQNPSCNSGKFEKLCEDVKIARKVARQFLKTGVEDGLISRVKSTAGAHNFTWIEAKAEIPWEQ